MLFIHVNILLTSCGFITWVRTHDEALAMVFTALQFVCKDAGPLYFCMVAEMAA